MYLLQFRSPAVLKSHVIMMDPDSQLLYQLLADVQLERFFQKIRDELNVTRVEHLDYVKDTDLELIGIRKPGFYSNFISIHNVRTIFN